MARAGVGGGVALEQLWQGALGARAAVQAGVVRAGSGRGRGQRRARVCGARAQAARELRAPVRRRAALLQRQQRARQPQLRYAPLEPVRHLVLSNIMI